MRVRFPPPAPRLFSTGGAGANTLRPICEPLSRDARCRFPRLPPLHPSATPTVRVHLLRDLPSAAQIQEMLEAQGNYIKLAVDVARDVVAGGGEYHADCEESLLEDGSRQDDIWGAD